MFAISCTGNVHFLGTDQDADPLLLLHCLHVFSGVIRLSTRVEQRLPSLAKGHHWSSLVELFSICQVRFLGHRSKEPHSRPARGFDDSRRSHEDSFAGLLTPHDVSSRISFPFLVIERAKLGFPIVHNIGALVNEGMPCTDMH